MDFSGAQAKISRANEQLRALDAGLKAFFAAQPYAIGAKYSPETAQINLYGIGYEEAPVTEWGVQIGECLHNLRSALDHTIWQFALDHLGRQPTETEAKKIQFPVAEKRRAFRNAQVRPFISQTHIDWIDNFQPYHDGAHARRNKLAVLSRLNNIDKHRVIHAAALVPEGLEMQIGEMRDVESYGSLEFFFGEPLAPDTPIGRFSDVVANGPHPYIDAEGPSVFSVVLADTSDAVTYKAPVLMLLGQLGEIVDAVVSTSELNFALKPTQ